jgi:hypothetical protein
MMFDSIKCIQLIGKCLAILELEIFVSRHKDQTEEYGKSISTKYWSKIFPLKDRYPLDIFPTAIKVEKFHHGRLPKDTPVTP